MKATISLKNRRFDEKSATKSTFVRTHREAHTDFLPDLFSGMFTLNCSELRWQLWKKTPKSVLGRTSSGDAASPLYVFISDLSLSEPVLHSFFLCCHGNRIVT